MVHLVLVGAIPRLPEAVEEHGPRRGVARLALVGAGRHPPPEVGVLEPAEGEERPLDSAHLPERFGEAVLARVVGELSEDHGGRHGADPDRTEESRLLSASVRGLIHRGHG